MDIFSVEVYIIMFFIYSFIGWLQESVRESRVKKKFVNRGFLIGPCCSIYGYGAILITLCLEKYIDDIVVTFVMGTVICALLEYLTSFFMEKMFNARWWDYSNRKFNLNGRICLGNLILFGLGGCIIMYITNPLIMDLVAFVPQLIMHIITIALLAIYAVDNVFSFIIMFNMKFVSNSNDKKDNTVEITEKIRKILSSKMPYKRLLDAFPTLNLKEKIEGWNQRLQKLNEETAKKTKVRIAKTKVKIQNAKKEYNRLVKKNGNNKEKQEENKQEDKQEETKQEENKK